MGVKKIIAIFVLCSGLAISVVGIRQLNRAKAPNPCVVSFAKSLGGKASFELGQAAKTDRYFGISGVLLGVFFTCVGGVLLFKATKS